MKLWCIDNAEKPRPILQLKLDITERFWAYILFNIKPSDDITAFHLLLCESSRELVEVHDRVEVTFLYDLNNFGEKQRL